MELLRKDTIDKEEPRNDNSDKPRLFDDDFHFKSAGKHREEWLFIDDKSLRDNISYQLQYLEFQIHLYNSYQMYLTLESLHIKNIVGILSGVVEAALYGIICKAKDKVSSDIFNERRSFLELIDDAYDMEIIDKEMRDYFHALRKDRNLVHFRALGYREHKAYDIDDVNKYIRALNRFVDEQNG